MTGGNFRFIVTTHTDKDYIHNHILINSIDLNSDKKLKWDYAQERNLRMISDRLAKEAGAIISFVGGAHGAPAAYGHVSFVEKVYPDGSFLISETNYNGNPNYTFHKLSGVDNTISFAYTTK